MCYSKIIVAVVIAANLWFADRILDIAEAGGAEPGITAAAWFAFTTGELWALSKIKCKKEEVKGSKPEAENPAESEGENDNN